MEEQLDMDSPAQKSSFYNKVTQAKEDIKNLLNNEHHSENVQKSVLGFSPRPSQMQGDKFDEPIEHHGKTQNF